MTHIEDAYRTFYKIWSDSYIPLISKSQKWFQGDDDLNENDIVYFKLQDSVLSSKWLVGRVEQIVKSKDNRVQRIFIGYKFDTEQGTRQYRIVERPALEVVKLLKTLRWYVMLQRLYWMKMMFLVKLYQMWLMLVLTLWSLMLVTWCMESLIEL